MKSLTGKSESMPMCSYCNSLGGHTEQCEINYRNTMTEHNTEGWEKRFDEEFVRDDGLMDKYGFDNDGEEETMATLIIAFIKSVEQEAREEGYHKATMEINEHVLPEMIQDAKLAERKELRGKIEKAFETAHGWSPTEPEKILNSERKLIREIFALSDVEKML